MDSICSVHSLPEKGTYGHGVRFKWAPALSKKVVVINYIMGRFTHSVNNLSRKFVVITTPTCHHDLYDFSLLFYPLD